MKPILGNQSQIFTRIALLIPSLVLFITNAADAKGPYLVKDINPGKAGSLAPHIMWPDGDSRLFFQADDGVHGEELWVSDGTEAGTYMVLDFEPGPVGSNPAVLPCANGNVFFAVYRELDRSDLYRSDGTEAGTYYLEAYLPYYGDAIGIGNFLFFVGADPGNHYNDELWRSDGTVVGTQKVKEIFLGPYGSHPWLFTEVNGLLYFRTSSPGSDLWKTDGTQAGTLLLGQGVRPFDMTLANGLVFFRGANDSGDPPDYELWVTDGTPTGTHRVKDIFPGQSASDPVALTAVGTRLFFTAKRKIGGPRELWISDGSESGTMMVDAQEGRDLINLGNVLIFWRWDALEGYRLWKSDGTAQGTIPIAFIAPPEVQEEPKEFIVVNGKLYFTADDGSHGRELWCYDPAFESAFMVADIRPGPDSGGPIVLTKVGTMLFFQYWTDEYWYELWALDTREALIPTISPIGAAALFGSLLVAGCLMSKRLGGPRSQTRGHD